MANWFCSVFNVVCVVNVCRSEIDSAWVVIVPGQKCVKKHVLVCPLDTRPGFDASSADEYKC